MPQSWGSLAETYAEGGCELHVHFRAGFVKGGEAGDWCAIFNRTEDYLDFIASDAFNLVEEGGGPQKRDMWQSVLVLDGKLVELPEEIVGEPVPSVVRLQPLDNCLGVWVDAPKLAVEFFEVIVATRGDDGKRGIALDAFGQAPALMRQRQLEGEVVEGITEVLDTVSDDEAEFGGRRRLEDFDPKELLGAINIGFGPNSIRVFFEPGFHFSLKAVQVVDRSV